MEWRAFFIGAVLTCGVFTRAVTTAVAIRCKRRDWTSLGFIASIVIEQLADELVAMTARARNAESDRDAYRLVAQQLLHGFHHVTVERDLLRGQLRINRRRRERDDQRRAA